MTKAPRSTLILSPLSRAGMRHDDNARFIYSDLPEAFAEAGSVCAVLPLVGLDQAQARAEMLAAFMHHHDYEDALFIDSDCTTSPRVVLKLAQLETEILACAYEDRLPEHGKGDDGGSGAFWLDTPGRCTLEVREGMRMLKIKGTGLGLTRIRRSAIEKLWKWAEETGGAPFWLSHFPGMHGMPVGGFFEQIVHEFPAGTGLIRRRSEDMSFFDRCYRAGIEVWCPAEVAIAHGGRAGKSLYDAMIEDERIRKNERSRVAGKLLTWPDNMTDGLAFVLEGAYDVPGLELEPGEVVLDIGANVGSFAAWAADRWPLCKIKCFEPHPEVADMLEKNTKGRIAPVVEINRVAVVGSGATRVMLHEGLANLGATTVFPLVGVHKQDGFEVPARHARTLPPASIIKCDAEGAEVEIIQHYPHWEGLKAVLLEWHTFGDYKKLHELCISKGLVPIVDRSRGRSSDHRELCFVRRDVLKESHKVARANGVYANGDGKASPDAFVPGVVEP